MASSTVLVSAPPRDTPFFDARTGRITQPWLGWFGSITATATIVQNLQTLQVIAEDNSTDGNSSEILTQLGDLVALLAEPRRPALEEIDELRAMIAAGLEANQGWRAECDELRALLVAGDPAPFGALGSAAFQSTTAFDAAGAASTAQANAEAYSSNASNLSSGTVPAARLPLPTTSSVGGVQAVTAVAHKWFNSISTSGVPSLSQPAFSDISGTIASAQVPTLNQNTTGTAANVTGTVAIANGGTGQVTAAAALAALGGASLTANNTLSGGQTLTGSFTVGQTSSAAASVVSFASNAQSGSESRTAVQNVSAGATFTVTLPDNSGGRIRIRAIQSGVALNQLYDNIFTSHNGTTTLGTAVQLGASTEFTVSLSGNVLTVTNTYANSYYSILVDSW